MIKDQTLPSILIANCPVTSATFLADPELQFSEYTSVTYLSKIYHSKRTDISVVYFKVLRLTSFLVVIMNGVGLSTACDVIKCAK